MKLFSADLLLVYYDENVYTVVSKKEKEIILNCKDDIRKINHLQFLNAFHNLYFNEMLSTKELDNMLTSCRKIKSSKKSNVHEYPEILNADGSKSILIHTYGLDVDCNLELSFIKQQKKAKKYKLRKWAAVLRKEEWRYNGFLKG